MSTLRDAMSHAALGWVKPELDETLRQVCNEVEAFVEEPGDTSRMRFCAGYLHQVQGTLRMVELYAPAMVAEELELLANAVRDGAVGDRDEACATLMRGTVLLPDYLERLQNGHRDIPIVLLPLLNEIRAARGAEGINESVLFAFNPEAGDASPAELEHARGSLSGRNRELLDTVGNAVKEELMRIKDALDLHVRMGGNPADLQTQVNELGAVSDTLGVMGLGVARGIVAQQRDALREVVAGTRGVDDNLLLDIAGALLYVDASLDDQVAHLGANVAGEDDPASVETRRTVEVLAHEAIANFTAARESFVAFIETNWDHERLAEVPRLLGEVSGALRMLELSEPADYLLAVRQYIDVELIGRQRVPSGRQLDTLADAMASLEYFLEALRDRRPGREEILDITRSSLETLRYWPIPAASVERSGEPATAQQDATVQPVEDLLLAASGLTAAAIGDKADGFNVEASPVAPAPPVPTQDQGRASPVASDDYPLVFGAAINARPEPLSADHPASPVESDAAPQASAFDPVAAETGTSGADTYHLAPIALEGHAQDAVVDAVRFEGSGFDPVAAEADASLVASDDAFTFDSSLLELDDAAPVDAGRAVEPQQVAPGPDAFFAMELEDAALPDVVQAAPMQDSDRWQLDDAALSLEPIALEGAEDAHGAETAVEADGLDAETAAFMAQLDAAAGAFDPAATAEPELETELAHAATASANGTPPLAAAPGLMLDGGFIDNGEEIDQDIRDVFIEEFDEELENLGKLLPAWRAAPANMERLRPVRRVFHTLKGSGRLVGARTLGEFSWKIESMLNRVLDGSRPASPAVLTMVSQAYDVLPELNAALRGAGQIQSDLLGMQDVADRVAAGEEAFHLAGAPATAVESTVAEVAADEPAAAPQDDLDGTPASVDSVLREILEAEIGVHLETVDKWLAASQVQPQVVSEDLLRAVHTMSGAFAMTDVPVITQITGPAESFVKRSLAASVTPTATGVAALAEMAAAVQATITALRDPSPRIPAFPGVAEQLQALADALPDAKWPPMPVDDDVIAVPPAAPRASLVDPIRPELAGVEDLSAYFDSSLLDGTPGELPVFEKAAQGTIIAQDELAVPSHNGAAETGEVPDEAVASHEQQPAVDAEGAVVPEWTITAEDELVAAAEPDNAVEASAPVEVGEAFTIDEAPSVTGQAEVQDAPVEAPVETETETANVVEPVTEASAEDAGSAVALSSAAADAVEPVDVGVVDGLAGDESVPAELLEAQPLSLVDEAVTFESEVIADDAVLEGGDISLVHEEDANLTIDAPETPVEALVPVIDAPLQDDFAEAEAEAEVGGIALDAQAQDRNGDAGEASHEADTDMHVATTEPEGEEPADVPVALVDGETSQLVEHGAPSFITAVEEAAASTPVLAPLTAPLAEGAAAAPVESSAQQFDAGPLDFEDLDRELVDIFVEEGKDLLDHCDGLISELRAAPEDREVLAGLQRDLHTLKGGARMAGINAIGDLGHSIESLLEAVAANRIEMTRADVQLLERGFDRLHQLLIRTGEHRAVVMPVDLVEAFEARTSGRGDTAAAMAEAGSPVAPAADTVAMVQPKPLVPSTPLSAPLLEEQGGEEEGTPRGQEQVRVRADLLDSLVNHAGEVAIYRSRLEQQLGAFRGAMAELDRTNARLRDQLRRLDLETEAQIVARYRREHEQADQTFDPLELDRFSTLQQLSRALNESAADLGGLQGVLDDLSRNYDVLLQQQSRVSSELQDGLMRARMVPFDGLVPRLRRVVRQAAQETDKQVHLKLEGTHGELDRNVLDRMVAPLEHMLRNSVAHGLELPAARAAAGKPEEGEIALRLRREGSEIVLEVGDDGAGLNREAIRRRAEQRGLLAADEQIDDNQLDQMIFASGFSTSEQVSQLAGRGVGMDVVRNEVRQLGGSVDIHSVRGEGATFTLRLPQTLAVTQAVFVRIGETTYAVPVASVSGIGRIARERFESGQSGYHYNGEDFSLYNLGALVGQAAAKAEGQSEIPLLLVRSGDLRAAVAIDQVLGNREIVVKPVGLQIASVPGIYGATITGEGNVVVILDVAPLVRRHLAQPAQPVEAAAVSNQRHMPLVMVVDDSLTMRKVTGRVLERHNLDVVAARDGVEALELLEERVPDLMLLDIEMPRMDGYELATAMRADPRYKDIPIVMITSRSGDKHRQRAFEIGVQRYLGKPYQELDLMRNVYDLLGIARARD